MFWKRKFVAPTQCVSINSAHRLRCEQPMGHEDSHSFTDWTCYSKYWSDDEGVDGSY